MRNGNYGEETNTGMSAFLAGALIGAGMGLLFAPQPGSELRGMLRDYANRTKVDLIDTGREAWDSAVEQGKEYYNKGEETIREAGRSVQEATKQGQEATKDAGRSAKEFAKQGKNVVEEAANEASRSRG
jgi:gas vesicle protein